MKRTKSKPSMTLYLVLMCNFCLALLLVQAETNITPNELSVEEGSIAVFTCCDSANTTEFTLRQRKDNSEETPSLFQVIKNVVTKFVSDDRYSANVFGSGCIKFTISSAQLNDSGEILCYGSGSDICRLRVTNKTVPPIAPIRPETNKTVPPVLPIRPEIGATKHTSVDTYAKSNAAAGIFIGLFGGVFLIVLCAVFTVYPYLKKLKDKRRQRRDAENADSPLLIGNQDEQPRDEQPRDEQSFNEQSLNEQSRDDHDCVHAAEGTCLREHIPKEGHQKSGKTEKVKLDSNLSVKPNQEFVDRMEKFRTISNDEDVGVSDMHDYIANDQSVILLVLIGELVNEREILKSDHDGQLSEIEKEWPIFENTVYLRKAMIERLSLKYKQQSEIQTFEYDYDLKLIRKCYDFEIDKLKRSVEDKSSSTNTEHRDSLVKKKIALYESLYNLTEELLTSRYEMMQYHEDKIYQRKLTVLELQERPCFKNIIDTTPELNKLQRQYDNEMKSLEHKRMEK